MSGNISTPWMPGRIILSVRFLPNGFKIGDKTVDSIRISSPSFQAIIASCQSSLIGMGGIGIIPLSA